MADISEKLLIDINNLIKGFVSIPGGNTQRIDSDKVTRRFKEQIAIFAQQRKTYEDARAEDEAKLDGKASIKPLKTKGKCIKKKIPPFEFQINKPSKPPEGYIWDNDSERYVPENDKIKEPPLPPDPAKWGLPPSGSPSELPCGQTEELPCSYATLTTIYDKNEKSPSMHIRAGLWDERLFALMFSLIDHYDNVKIENAITNVKDDLMTLYTKVQSNENIQGMDWKEAKSKAEEYVLKYGFTSVAKIAQYANCGETNLKEKIIPSSEILRKAKAEKKKKTSPETISINIYNPDDKTWSQNEDITQNDKESSPDLLADINSLSSEKSKDEIIDGIIKYFKIVNNDGQGKGSTNTSLDEQKLRENLSDKTREELAEMYISVKDNADEIHQDDPKKTAHRRKA